MSEATNEPGATPAPATNTTAATEWIEEEFGRVLGVTAAEDDDFFALGGSSLDAAKLAMRLSARSGSTVRIADVLRHRTPEALAKAIGEADAAPETIAASVPAGGVHPVSRSQRFYGWAYRGGLHRAVICVPVPLPDGAGLPTVRSALATVTSRHDSLRLHITATAEGQVQRALPIDAVADLIYGRADGQPALLTAVEVAGGREAVAEEAERITVQEQARGMNVDGAPLFRGVLVTGDEPAGARPSQLVLSVHHLVFDGASAAILARELRAACLDPDSLPEAPPSYHRFALDSLRQEQLREEPAQRWWRGYLDGFQGCHLSVRRGGDESPTWNTALTLPDGLNRSLAQRSRQYRVPVSTLRLAGMLVVVHALCDTRDAAVCMPVNERSPAWADTIGMFIDCVVVRHVARDGETVQDMVERLSADLTEVMEHRTLGFDRVAGGVAGDHAAERYPLSGLVMNSGSGFEPGLPADQPRHTAVGRPMLLDVQLYIGNYPDRVDVEAQYRSELLGREEMAQVLQTFAHVLSQVAESGATPVLELVAEARRRLALATGTA